MKFYITLLAALSLMACGGESDDNSSNASSPAQISGFAGVYEDFIDEGNGEVDELYMVIHDTGSVSYYDYAGDSYDNYANCYWVSHRVMQIRNAPGQGTYRLEFYVDDRLDGSGNFGLTVNSQGFNIIASDGTFNYPRSNLLISDLTPECDS